jgi:hypothetical protein
MATKADFTEEEWETLRKGVSGAGTLASLSDRDFTDSFGEASALAKYLVAQRDQGSSELVRALAHERPRGFGITASPQEVETETVDALHSATRILGEKAPDDVDAYRQLVLGLMDAVAEAKGGVTPEETAAIQKVKDALGSA